MGGAGDVNKDGYADLIVGAWGKTATTALTRHAPACFSGKDGKILYTFNGDSANDNFGGSVSGAGDVNKDGFPDVIVGAATLGTTTTTPPSPAAPECSLARH